jgi:hypothetical protein
LSTQPEVIEVISAGGATCGSCHPGGHYRGASLDAYLKWAEAQAIMTANGVDASLQNTPHGGYTANTTKCAVCHSVHRAQSNVTAAGIGTYTKLTPGAQACIACHTAWGANPIPTALVEWAEASSGPHNSFGCLGACHAGVHGGTVTEYGAIQAFNLTNRNDPAIAAAFAAGNVSSTRSVVGTDTANYPLIGGSNKHATYAVIDDTAFRSYVTTVAQDLSTMRAMATGYTCGASGCHSSSQFAVNKHGYAELRAQNPAASTTLNQYMTAHITNMPSGCGPCHVTNDNKCAACHDMIGKVTNSSAFPHANRNIVVLEKTAGGTWTTGTITDKTVASGNLWMYRGDATYRDGSGAPTSTVTYAGIAARTVIDDAAGFHDGHAGDINDGTCLKCHGYKYWPTHGLQDAGSHGGSAALNFSTK